MNPYSAIKTISKFDYPCIVCFSAGRDSIVMLDLMAGHYKGDMTFAYFYFVPNLSYKERILRFYEKKYGIKIERLPCWTTLSYVKGKTISEADYFRYLRKKYNVSWIAMGNCRAETVTRRLMMTNFVGTGVDERNHYYYPLVDWTTAQVAWYVKMHNLPIGDEYRDGFKHDIWTPDNGMLLYIKNQYPADYEKIIKTFPNLEAGVKKMEFYRGQ